MDSPNAYDDGMMEGDDVVYPCKGCGDILEEGKAFELAGNRWHIDCFRCHTCGTLLDSDANLLLLGDGSLICNNCTYSCSACGNKIEDLAILTGDQAFCAGCFRCRSCKRKIDNLRYARTSQGIFCMSCHESLMARRRKKAKRGAATSNGSATIAPDKALPSLPPSASHGAAFVSSEVTSPAESLTGTPRAGSPVSNSAMKVPSSRSRQRDVSPFSEDGRDGTTLPSSTYQSSSNRSVHKDDDDDGEIKLGFLPMAFDPNPAPRAPQISRKKVGTTDSSPAPSSEHHQSYFTGRKNGDARSNASVSSRSASAEREALHNLHFPTVNAPKLSPHIAFQDKKRSQTRSTSETNTPGYSPVTASHTDSRLQQSVSSASSVTHNDNFNLQDAPKGRKPATADSTSSLSRQRNVNDDGVSPVSEDSDINPFEDPKLHSPAVPAAIPARHADRPARGDSLGAPKPGSNSARSSMDPALASSSKKKNTSMHDRQESLSSVHTYNYNESLENDAAAATADQQPPPRASSRPLAPFTSAKDDFVAPRIPPQPPADEPKHSRSASTQLSDGSSADQNSPGTRNATTALPRLTSDGTFTMDKEMSRIMKGDRDEQSENTSMLRRVSNAVKHGRSFSDRGSLSKIVAAPNGATAGPDVSIASPSTVSSSITSPVAGSQESVDSLRAQLRRAHQRITALEAEKLGLEEKVNTSAVIEDVNDELNQKRTTMAFLDSQREIVVRELETMTRHLERVKNQKQPLDLPALKSDILEDFAEAMEKLKDHIGTQIEDLMRKRNELTNEITDLIAMKDKGFQEYESLSQKNAQLLGMNNQLLVRIQENFKANKGDANKSNGLGIYHPNARVEGLTPSDMRSLNLISSDSSYGLHDTDADSATVLTAPQVVNIRKGQPKKFNWRKGGASVAKGVTKGIKGAFAAGDNKPGLDASQIGMPYGMTQQQATPGGEMRQNAAGQGFGLFAQKGPRTQTPVSGTKDSSMVPAADPSVLFGSELEARCEFEKRIIPNIVMRCVAEVETRGMHVEGIYRKSGGSGQVKSVQAGFEKDSNHDIGDPDLEIHAVTSALKQYLRKLPTPLITYDAYDSLLEAGSITEKSRQVVALRQALTELPPHHRGCLEYLVRHLARVMSYERDNLMTPLNLAVVFAPTIMRPLSIEREMSDGLAQRAAVQALLELHESVFEED